ncbi:MAG: molybdopterin-dependent oxidoreductase, partial [Chloroflexi bacterium]|nr:molybdopterin-dependent oxidoreductase [Chloroflexota bacterium]
MELELSINGVIESLDIAANESLLSMLRREGYCSVKHGCETGDCGACTVLVEGVPRPSCLMLAAQAGGCSLTTVENLGSARKLHPLQQAFIDVGAVQCGFCTPGMLLSAYALLKSNQSPTEDEVRDALSGNLCRCAGYTKPVQAVMRAAAIMRGEMVPPIEYNLISQDEVSLNSLSGQSHVVGVKSGSGTSGKMRAVTASKAAAGATTKIPAIMLSNGAAMLSGLRPDAQLQVVGKPVPNIDALKMVTGQATFAADNNLRAMLYARILTSPHAHAVIRNIDVSQAKALPGVHAVLTYKEVARVPYSSVERSPQEPDLRDQYCLDYKVRYVGDRVAAVAAETPEVAEQAIGLIKVDYDVQPAILDPRQALEQSAPVVHPESESRGIYEASRNIAARVRAETGDIERGFAEADLVVEGEYFVPTTQPAPIETHTVVTYFDEDNYLVVRTSTQAPHHIRRALARILDMHPRRIRVVTPEVGGGFGVKQEIVLEDICALLTLATNQPVTLTYSRAQEFVSSRVRQQYILRLKTGVKRDGTLVANQVMLLASTGAYGTHPLIRQGNAASSALALYPCPNMRFVAEILYTNQPPAGALRGYGAPQEFFALESHMDEIARQLNMDALELRRKNWIKVADEYPLAHAPGRNGDIVPLIESCALPECLQIVEEKLNWKEKRKQAHEGRFRHGVGIALSMYGTPGTSADSSGAIIKLNEDGSFDVFANANDGNSGSATLLAQIAAEVLGVPMEDILMHTSDTASIPFGAATNASATLYGSGGAVKKAAEQIRRQILTVAGRMLNTLPEAL